MVKKVIFIGVMLAGIMFKCPAQDAKHFQEINKMYLSFQEAFDSLNIDLFAEIHSRELIRVPGGRRIENYKTYIEKQRVSFEKAKEEHRTRSIDFRFIERVHNDSIASERGIYKFVSNKNSPDERMSFGKFHVLLMKEDGAWKITVDYDSSEGGTIDAEDYKMAAEMNDFERFLKK